MTFSIIPKTPQSSLSSERRGTKDWQFVMHSHSITVGGLSSKIWDDCLSIIRYQGETPSAIASSFIVFAVAQKSGKIKIHDDTIFQELYTLDHNEPIKLLRFGDNGDFLASVAAKSICIWSARAWENIWTIEIDAVCMDLSFVDDD